MLKSFREDFSMNNIILYLEEFNVASITLRLICAALMGALIGVERASQHQTAGLRTFSVVCLGSALAQIVDMRCVMVMGTGDPVRLAQGVINGLGFIGVGTIIVTKENHIKGLTTAATLWTTAVLGICIGSGYLWGSVISFILILFIVKFLSYASRHLDRYNKEIDLIIEVDNNEGVKKVTEYIRNSGYRILVMEKTQFADYMNVHMEIDLGKKADHKRIVDELYKLKNVNYVQENG